MTEDIHKDCIIKVASNEQLRALAPARLRPMLDAIQRGAGSITENQQRKLLEECVNFSAISNDSNSLKAFVEILSHKDLSDATLGATESLAQLADAPQARGKKLAIALRGQKKIILKFLNIPLVDETPRESDETKRIDPEFGLRYYQLMSVRDICANLSKEKRRVMFHAPTGTGKTRMAMSVVSRHLREIGPTIVLWVASGHELVSQAGNAFSQEWKFHGDTSCQLRAWHGDNPHFLPQDAPEINIMLITSLQKLAAAVKKSPDLTSFLRKIVTLVVFDEAHQAVAPIYRKLIDDILKGENVRLLGLSATPGRASNDETAELVDLFNCKKISVWRPEGQGLIEYLVGKGYLAHANFIPVNLSNESTINAMGKTDTNDEEFDNETFIRIGENVERNLKIVEICKKALTEGHSRVLAFTPSVDAAHFCVAALKATYSIGKNCCEVVDSNTPPKKREKIIERYKNTAIYPKFVIFNYNVMTTGVDVPATSALVIGRPTKSVTQYAQMVGRAIRGDKSGGNRKADIYTVIDSALPAFQDVAAAFFNWNKHWRNNYE